jgi:hypothetical protein
MKDYIKIQIDKIRSLKDNWYEEGVGKPYSSDDLDWFLKEFSEHYSEEFPEIFIYPSYDDNTLNIEWRDCDNFAPSMYINIKDKNAIIYSLYLKDNEFEDEKVFNSINDDFWKYVKEDIVKKLYK